MNAAALQLEAGGLVLPKTKVDVGATEQIVARTYLHPALAGRKVIRLASDRLGQAEDLAMEFLGFEAPAVSGPVAVQQRRSLGFASWALINDPANARFALDLVKRMKAADRRARSKPGHAWDAYLEMAKELGRSAPHFLPPFWEEAGRTFKDLGNQTYAGRALNKSLEAERVHALESDRARRRDVVLEFVLSGCLSGNALSDYGNDLQNHSTPSEAFAVFRDLCVRRTRGGMAPWAALPKDLTKLAKAAGLDGDKELEKWLEEVIEAPAMGRVPLQFWKSCSSHCRRIVARNPEFAVVLLRHTRPEARYYGESKVGPWLELLEEWGVLDFLWEDEHRGSPALGEPIAAWFGRIVRDDVPAPQRTLEMLEKLAPRLKREKVPLELSQRERYRATAIDIDFLEACLSLGVKVADPPEEATITFAGWLTANVDHPRRNQDIILAAKDERFATAIAQGLDEALACRGGAQKRGYRQSELEQRAFPLAAGDRPGIKELWHRQTSRIVEILEDCGLASFEMALDRLSTTLWPDTLRQFPDLKERLERVDAVAMLARTLHAGVFDEYGLPAFEEAVDRLQMKVERDRYGAQNLFLTFPNIVLTDMVHAHVIGSDGRVTKHELRLPKKCALTSLIAIGNDLAISFRNDSYQGIFHWASDPAQQFEAPTYYWGATQQAATPVADGSFFLGQQAVRPGDKQLPQSKNYVHDGERFWSVANEYDATTNSHRWQIREIDPQTGKPVRGSVPAWFEETDGGTIELGAVELLQTPPGAEDSPLGATDRLLGWKTVKRRDCSYFGVGIDGRRWDQPIFYQTGVRAAPVALLRQPGTDEYLPITTTGARQGSYFVWDPSGTTIVAVLTDFQSSYASGQVMLLPLLYWHLLKPRDVASSRKLRGISPSDSASLLEAATKNRAEQQGSNRGPGKDETEAPLGKLLSAVKQFLPTAPERMAVGVARVVERAEQATATFIALRDKASADSTKETTNTSAVVNHLIDEAAAHWGMQSFHIYGPEAGKGSFSEHLAAAAGFLRGETRGGNLPRSAFLWFSMLENLPLHCWKTYWRALGLKMAQKDKADVPWLEFLKYWHELGIAALPGQFALMEGCPEGAKKNSWGGYDVKVAGGTSYSIQNEADLFIVVENESYYHNASPYHILRYSTSDNPGTPPGFAVKNIRKLKLKYDPTEIGAFIAAAEACTEPPLPTKEELAEVAGQVSASPAEIGLVWIGGLNVDNYQSNFLPSELRQALGWKTTEANAGRQALRNLNQNVLEQLYEAVVSEGCAAPFSADRQPVLRAIARAWQARMPKRFQLEAALQTRLSALGKTSRWQRLDHVQLLAVAADPTGHPLLQPREIEIKVASDRGYGGLHLAAKNKSETVIAADAFRSIVQLTALVHAETAAGHPARADLPPLLKQTGKLLDHSSTLLDLRSVHLYPSGNKTPLTPVAWLNKHVGKTTPNAKDGTARLDDGLLVAAALDSKNQALIAFRAAKLRDQADLSRLQGILGVGVGEDDFAQHGILPIIAVLKSPGFQQLAKAIPAKELPEGSWPQNPSHTASPVVAAIRGKHKLGEEAALLYAQLLALPDPTSANVCKWNGWTAAQFKKAAAELVAAKLVMEAVRARAGRSVFLPGEWMELKTPWLPIESWKFSHLVELELNTGEPCPAGGPLVLRPFEDLFAAAWRRVQDGDAPRYEEVKRKKKKK